MSNNSVDIIGITNTGDVQVFNGSGQSIIITTGTDVPSSGKIIISATDGVPGYLSSKIGAGLTIIGTTLSATVTTLDGKILANATDETANYLQTKIGAGLTASGTNILALITTLDGKVITTSSGETPGYLVSKLGTGLSYSGTNIIWATNAFSVLDYGAQTNTGTAKSTTLLKIAYGICSIPDATATISGLLFADATSYKVALTINTASAVTARTITVTNLDGASFAMRSIVTTQVVQWIAIGV